MARKKIRKVHIYGKIWHYVYKSTYEAFVNIYSPNRVHYIISAYEICCEKKPEYEWLLYPGANLNVTPSKVKNYILNNILNEQDRITNHNR